MCHFITMVAPEGTEKELLKGILRKHNRGFGIIENKHVSKALKSGEIYFHTVDNFCDCGTALGFIRNDNAIKDRLSKVIAREKAKKVRQGWSNAKIDRWYQDKLKNKEKKHKEPCGDPDGWSETLADLKAAANLAYVGIMLHFYSGDLDSEHIELTRKSIPLDDQLEDYLWQMSEDELLIVS